MIVSPLFSDLYSECVEIIVAGTFDIGDTDIGNDGKALLCEQRLRSVEQTGNAALQSLIAFSVNPEEVDHGDGKLVDNGGEGTALHLLCLWGSKEKNLSAQLESRG